MVLTSSRTDWHADWSLSITYTVGRWSMTPGYPWRGRWLNPYHVRGIAADQPGPPNNSRNEWPFLCRTSHDTFALRFLYSQMRNSASFLVRGAVVGGPCSLYQ